MSRRARLYPNRGSGASPSNRRARAPGLALAFVIALSPVALVAAPESSATRPADAREGAAAVAGVHLVAEVDRASITIAERVALRVTLMAPAGIAVTMPEFSDELGGFAIVARATDAPRVLAAPEGAGDERRVVHVQRLTLEPFLAGAYTIPALEARVGSQVARSEAIVVRVASVIAPGEEPAPAGARDVIEPGVRASHWGVIAGALVACGLLGVGVAWRARGRAPLAPPLEALALSRLGEIERSPAPDARLAHDISASLRSGLAGRTGLPLDRLTTPELAARLASLDMPGAAAGVLFECDEARFGGRALAPDEVRSLARRACDALQGVAPSARTPGMFSPGEEARP